MDRGASPSLVCLECYIDGHHITSVQARAPVRPSALPCSRSRLTLALQAAGGRADHRHAVGQHSLQHVCGRAHGGAQRAVHSAHSRGSALPQLPAAGGARVLRDRDLPSQHGQIARQVGGGGGTLHHPARRRSRWLRAWRVDAGPALTGGTPCVCSGAVVSAAPPAAARYP